MWPLSVLSLSLITPTYYIAEAITISPFCPTPFDQKFRVENFLNLKQYLHSSQDQPLVEIDEDGSLSEFAFDAFGEYHPNTLNISENKEMILLFALSGILALLGGTLLFLLCFKFVKLLSKEYEEELEAQRHRIRTRARLRGGQLNEDIYFHPQDQWVEQGVFTVRPYQPKDLYLEQLDNARR